MRFWADGRRMLAATTVLIGASVLLAQAAEARTNYAVLVGVTKYPNIEGADLVGPANDVVLVRDYLTGSAPVPFEPRNVTVLADDVEDAAGAPTHAAITGALARVAAEAERGDFVYVQLSGHGIQQPAVDPSAEPDGMDEAFLPADIGQWTDRSTGIPSAFTDNQIGEALEAIRAKGAFVWIVIDACHSGTATRAAGLGEEDVVERKLDPGLVGIPASAFEEAAAEARAAQGGDKDREATRALSLYASEETEGMAEAEPTGATALQPGGMVAFFAAQTVETTPEMPLPRGEQDAKRYGLFTYTLLSRIAENPAMSYRQLGQSILQAYAAENRNRPTPLFEGNLDAPVFGTADGDFVRQWKVKVEPTGITLDAGRLHGMAPGARLAVLPSPGAATEEALGYLEVRSAENLTAKVVTVEAEGKAALAPSSIPPDAYARLTQVAFDTELTVSRPPLDGRHAGEAGTVARMLEAIAADQSRPLKLRFVDAGETADVKLAVMSEADVAKLVADAGTGGMSATAGFGAGAASDAPRLWFLSPTGEVSLAAGRRPPSIGFAGSTPEGLENEVADTLQRVFRATNLARLAAASDFRPEEFSASFDIVRSGGAVEPLAAGRMPRVTPGDQINLVARNDSGKPVDMNVLYVGSDYSIGHMYAERLHGGSEVNLPLLQFNAESFGIERMVVVLSEAKPQSAMQDLGFLAQEGVRQTTRSADHPDGFAGLLRDIGTAPATRGAMRLGQAAGARGAVLIYPVENLPEG